jgi:hypothetical protein
MLPQTLRANALRLPNGTLTNPEPKLFARETLEVRFAFYLGNAFSRSVLPD